MAETVANIAVIAFIASVAVTTILAARAAARSERNMVLRPIPVKAKTRNRRIN